MTLQRDIRQEEDLTLENIPPEVFYHNLAPYLSYQSARMSSLASRLLHDVFSAHLLKKFCFKPPISSSRDTKQSRTLHQWEDASTLQEVRTTSYPFYRYYLVDQHKEKSPLEFQPALFSEDSTENRITDFGIINKDLFWIVFAGTYCAVVNRHTKRIQHSGFFDLEVLASATDMIAFDGVSTLYFSVKNPNSLLYLEWNVEKDRLNIIQNFESLNKLPVIRHGCPGYFAVLLGGGILQSDRAILQRLIVTPQPYESPIAAGPFLSIQESLEQMWANFSRNFSTQYRALSNNNILLISPFGELELHLLLSTKQQKWSKLLFRFNPPQIKLFTQRTTWIDIKDFSVSQDEKILAILYQSNFEYKIHIWDLQSKRLLNILTIPSVAPEVNSALHNIHFENHNIIVSSKTTNVTHTFHFDQHSMDSIDSLKLTV